MYNQVSSMKALQHDEIDENGALLIFLYSDTIIGNYAAVSMRSQSYNRHSVPGIMFLKFRAVFWTLRSPAPPRGCVMFA